MPLNWHKLCPGRGTSEYSVVSPKPDDGGSGSEDKVGRYETILTIVGGFGWYQGFMLAIFCLMALAIGANNGFMIYGRLAPPEAIQNCTEYIPLSVNRSAIDDLYCRNQSLDVKFYSVTIQMNLVGPLSYIPAMMMSVQLAGMLVGALAIGQLSDTLGRKPSLLICQAGMLVFGGTAMFIESWELFIASRFAIGFFTNAAASVAVIFVQEFMLPQYRMVYQIIGISIGYIFGGLVAILTRHWRPLSIYIQMPVIPAVMLTLIAAESPKWLIEKGRIEDARKTLSRMAKWNKVQEDVQGPQMNHEMDKYRREAENKKRALGGLSYWNLFYSREATKNLCIVLLCWCTTGAIYYGILFNIGDLAGDPPVNAIIIALARSSIQSTLFFIEKIFPRLGRRLAMQIGLLGVICSLGSICVAHVTHYSDAHPTMVTVAAILGVAFTGFLWPTVYTIGVEMFPTVLRNMGFSLCTSFARAGAAISPQIFLLLQLWRPAPYLIIISISATCLALVTLWLPETRGKPLPDLPNKTARDKKDSNSCIQRL